MKRKICFVLCILGIAMICACGKEGSGKASDEVVTNEVQNEVGADEAEKAAQVESENVASEEEMSEPDASIGNAQILGGQSLEKEVKEEEEPVLEQDPNVFEEITTELTTHPVLKYTIMGEQRQIDYTMYENSQMYDMISNASYAIDYSTGDVTGDGVYDLVVSLYIIGNTLTESLQDTYVYSIDADINDLNEILYIPSQGGEQFVSGYPNNVGAYPSGNGTLRLDLASMKGEGGTPPTITSVELVYQDGMWSVK